LEEFSLDGLREKRKRKKRREGGKKNENERTPMPSGRDVQ
jgi:hypothetical protein